jgi:hypothetical protein
LAARYLWYSGVPGCGPLACRREEAAVASRLLLTTAAAAPRPVDTVVTAGGKRPPPYEDEGVETRTVAIASAGTMPLMGRGEGLLVRTS